MLVRTLVAEVTNSPLDNTLPFVKDKDVILTTDYWRIVVNFDLSAYKDATTLRKDLSGVLDMGRHTAPIGEL